MPSRPRRSRPAVVVAALAAAACLLLTGCSGGTDAVDQSAGSDNGYVATRGFREWPVGQRPGPVTVRGTTLDGAELDLGTLRGKVVVLNWWGQWCAPCRAEADDLEAVHRATADRGVAFVGVNVKDTEDRARAFVRSQGITYPSLFDPAGRVALRFRATPVSTTPVTIVLDRDGRVAARWLGGVLSDDLQPVIERLAAQR